ncbi:MAG TPA: DUF2846 domain-containing protein [Burkholderiales bacterium]|nr:DUF2846 domain-containing protein [Burkholderiales bacterium]
MPRSIRWLLAALALALLPACATGPRYAEVEKTLPKVAADKGRVWFYRSGIMFGAGIQPSVLLNGEKVGDSVPGGFFYVDRNPGSYEVLLSTEVDRKVTFTLESAQERYVRMTVGLGVIVYRVYPELVDPAEGRKEIVETSYIGGKDKK